MIIFYYGSDTYRMTSAVADTVTRFRAAHHQFRHESFDCIIDGHLDEIERIFKYPSLFEQTTLMVIKNALGNADNASSLARILHAYRVPSDTTVLVCHDGTGTRSSAVTALMLYLKKHADEVEEFQPLTGAERARWVTTYCADRNCTIAPAAVLLLIQRTAGESWALAHEMDKLCAYAGGTPLTPDMVRLLTPERPEHDEFELANALIAKDKRSALSALWSKIREGTPLPLLLGALSSSIRTLIAVKDLSAQRMSAAAIAKTMAFHPYVVAKALRGASLYTDITLRAAHEALARLDRETKDGRADAEDGLFSVVLAL